MAPRDLGVLPEIVAWKKKAQGYRNTKRLFALNGAGRANRHCAGKEKGRDHYATGGKVPPQLGSRADAGILVYVFAHR